MLAREQRRLAAIEFQQAMAEGEAPAGAIVASNAVHEAAGSRRRSMILAGWP
jgi:hypothetical protein